MAINEQDLEEIRARITKYLPEFDVYVLPKTGFSDLSEKDRTLIRIHNFFNFERYKFFELPNWGFREDPGWNVFMTFSPSLLGGEDLTNANKLWGNTYLSTVPVPHEDFLRKEGYEDVTQLHDYVLSVWNHWGAPIELLNWRVLSNNIFNNWRMNFLAKRSLRLVDQHVIIHKSNQSKRRQYVLQGKNKNPCCARCLMNFETNNQLKSHWDEQPECKIWMIHNT